MPLSCCPDAAPPVPNLDGSLAQITTRFLRVTKLHGLHYMGSRPQSWIQRLFWSGAFLASVGLLCTWSANRVHYLLSKPVHTRADMLWTPWVRFPAVTFCNHNPARFLHLTRPDLYSVGHWLGLTYENHSLLPTILEELPEEQRPWLSRLANYSRFLPPRLSPHTMESFFHRMGHQIEDMLLECHFRGKPCAPQDFNPVSGFHSCTQSGGGGVKHREDIGGHVKPYCSSFKHVNPPLFMP